MAGIAPANPVWHFSVAGEPASGYKVYTYLNGTTTPSTTWQDAGQTSANTNPIILGSDGNATIFIADGTEYTFQVNTALDAPVQTIDDIAGATFSSGTVTGDVTVAGFLRVEAGTAAEPALRVGDAETGLYGDASNLRVSIGGVLVGTFSATGLALPGALAVTGAVTGASAAIAGAGTFGSVTTADLSVTGELNFDGSAGTSGQVPVSAGDGATPVWTTFGTGINTWICFNGTGTPAILGSRNITGITDNGVGDYTINFTTPFADVNYAVIGSHAGIDAGRSDFGYGISQNPYSSYTVEGTHKLVGSCRVITGAATPVDAPSVSVAFIR
jgi:hypothetical protein